MGLNCCASYIYYGIAAISLYYVIQLTKKYFDQKKLDRWKKTPKDIVIIHGMPRAKTVPYSSPFVLKIHTYLRMANIHHKEDPKDTFGPKGKAPWITLNGQHITDSQFIIAFLGKKFDKSFKGTYTEDQLALSSAMRIILEEHFFWGMALQRFVFGGASVHKLIKRSAVGLWLLKLVNSYAIKRSAHYQGIGRHTPEEIFAIMKKDLIIVSSFLGNKKYILGDEPCEDDCGVFGVLAQALWGLPDSPYEKVLSEELPNLKEYCLRMKEKFYSDWEHCLAK